LADIVTPEWHFVLLLTNNCDVCIKLIAQYAPVSRDVSKGNTLSPRKQGWGSITYECNIAITSTPNLKD